MPHQAVKSVRLKEWLDKKVLGKVKGLLEHKPLEIIISVLQEELACQSLDLPKKEDKGMNSKTNQDLILGVDQPKRD